MTGNRRHMEPGNDAVAFAAGRYVVARRIAAALGKRVYLARDVALGRDVAVTVLDRGSVDAVHRGRPSAKAGPIARLSGHDRIVPVYDVGETEGGTYVVSQYMEGGSLQGMSRAAPEHRLPIARAMAIAAQVCEALEYAHGEGVVHGEVAPANVWLTRDGDAKLGDFAVSLTADQRNDEPGATTDLIYRAPEQSLGVPADARSDLYSLGAMLYEMVTGRPPFLGEDAVAVIHQHLHETPLPPTVHNPAVPVDLSALILALLAKRSEDRPAIGAVRAALSAVSCASASQEGREPNRFDRLAGEVFVGRRREMVALRAALDEARDGCGRLVLLHGEAGVGKTRIAEQLAGYARLRHVPVVWASCPEDRGTPAFWPWRQVVRSLAAEVETPALRTTLGRAAPDVAHVVPEVRVRLPDVPVLRDMGSDHDRLRLFVGLARFLANTAARTALLVVLDDVHAADVSSLLVLQYIAREARNSRLLLVAMYRDEAVQKHGLTRLLGEIGVDSTRLEVTPFSERETGQLLAAMSGFAPPSGLVTALQRRTEGNPFFTAELIRVLLAEKTNAQPFMDLSLLSTPDTVRAATSRRLGGFSAAARRTLAVAAVIGREFRTDVLCAADEDPARVHGVLEHAGRARLVERSEPGRWRFAHALVRETLYELLPASQRAGLHRTIGEAIEATDARAAELPLAEIAYHFSAAGPEKRAPAVAYARRAADRALAVLAYEQASGLYRLAFAGLEQESGRDERMRAEVLLGLGDSHRRAGEAAPARAAYERALVIARRLGAGELIARAGLGIVNDAAYRPEVVDATAIDLLEEALRGASDGPPSLRAAVLGALSMALNHVDHSRSLALIREALALAEAEQPAILAGVLRTAFFVLWVPDVSVEERLILAYRLRALGEATAHRETTAEACIRIGFALLECGDIEGARGETATLEAIAMEVRQPLHGWFATVHRVTHALLAGRLIEAGRLAEDAMPAAEAAHASALPIHAGQLLTLRLLQGRLEDAEEIAQDVLRLCPLSGALRAALVAIHAEAGRLEDARHELEELAADGFRGIRRDQNWIPAISLLALAAATLGDGERAKTLYDALLPCAVPVIVASLPVACLGATARYLGLLAWVGGAVPVAEGHFEDALVTNRRIGALPWLAATQYDYARMLIARAGDGDRRRAIELLREAGRIAGEVGMAGLGDRVSALEAQIGG